MAVRSAFVRRRVASRAGLLVAAGATALVACAVVVLLTTYSFVVVDSGLRRAIGRADAGQRTVEVSGRVQDDVDHIVRSDIRAAFGSAPVLVHPSRISDPLTLAAGSAQAGVGRAVLLTSPDLPTVAHLTAGTWPPSEQSGAGQPLPVAVHAAAAGRLGLEPGSSVTVTTDAGPLVLRVVGLWVPNSPADGVWAGSPLETSGRDRDLAGPFVVTASAASALASAQSASWTTRWRVEPDPALVRPADLPALRDGAQGLADRLNADPHLAAVSLQVATGLPDLLAALQGPVRQGQSGSAAVLLLLVVLAGVAVASIARLLAEHRRTETVLVRARGASRRQLTGWSAMEAALVALPAAALAVPVGVAALDVSARAGAVTGLPAGSLQAGAVAVPALTAAALSAAVLTLVLTFTGGRLPRAGGDVVLLVLAAVAIWQLRAYGGGNPTSGQGPDLVLVASPVLALLGGAVVAKRLVPLVGRVWARASAGTRGLVPALLPWQVGRRSRQLAVPVALLALAVATSTLAVAFGATAEAGVRARAGAQVGADLRATIDPARNTTGLADAPSVAGALAAVPGVRGVATASRFSVDAGGASFPLLAIDATAARGVVDLGPGTRSLLAGLTSLSTPLHGIDLPAGSTGLVLETTWTAGIARPFPGFDSGEPATVTLAALVRSPEGVVARIDLAGDPRSGTSRQEAQLPAGSAGTARGWQLVGVDAVLRAPQFVRATFDWAVTGLAVKLADGRTAPVAVPDALPGWSAAAGSGPSLGPQAPQVSVGSAGRLPTVRAVIDAAGPIQVASLRLAPGLVSPGAVPVVLTRALAASMRVRVGEEVTVQRGGLPLPLHVTGVFEAVPTLTGPGALVDLRSLDARDLRAAAAPTEPSEWWVSLPTSAVAADAAAAGIARAAGPLDLQRRTSAEQVLREDPLAGGPAGALALGVPAAVLLALAGLLAAAAAGTGQRRTEGAILRALGATTRQVSITAVAERCAVVGAGLAAGIGVGVAGAALVLPALARAPTVVLPWPQVLAAAGACAAVPLLVSVVAGLRPSGDPAARLRWSQL